MKTGPQECEVPPNSRAAQLLQGASFYDAWRITSQRMDRSALEHFLAAADRTPRWVNAAMAARNRLVQLVGLKNLGTLADIRQPDATAKPAVFKPGDRIGIFTLIEERFEEVLLGDKDRHLDVVLSVHRQPLAGQEAVEITLTTIVHVKNLLGRLYMLPVTPAHRVIAPAVLKDVAD